MDLEIEGLYKSYTSQSVLVDLDLVVDDGSFTSILGPSGSGKTTLLRIIVGFEHVDRGVVRLDQRVVDDGHRYIPPDRRRIGYVSQEGSLFPHLTVNQNVGFGLPRAERRGSRVSELLAMVGLIGVENRYPHQLSGGQQQRVALARALAIQPLLVLLDEPFSALDAALRESVRSDVRRVLRDTGTTAILVTHDQDEALSLADHVAVMDNGRIGQFDTPQGLYAHPLSPELARSLGETNFIPGVAKGGRVETPLGSLALDNGPVPDGTRLRVLIRPEQIALDASGTEPQSPARVVESEFFGHDTVVRVRPEWKADMTLVVRTPGAAPQLPAGTRVNLSARGAVVGWPELASL
jgi:iron(III) transport system ATP-binding protein